ncbi:MAG TPA: hypothetical protein VGJ34_05460 [Gaiellaceae bacterium]|jgi:hypothetical protein
MRVALAAAALCAALALVTGCGSDVVSLDPVADAATKTQTAGSARFSLKATFTINHDHAQSMAISGDGIVNMATSSARMQLRYELPAEIQATLPGDMTMEAIFDGSDGLVVYMKMSLLRELLPPGKEWLKFDLEKFGKAKGIDLREMMQANQGDPMQTLQYLRSAGNVEKVGVDLVRRVRTTHYRATIDLRKTLEQAPESLKPSLDKILSMMSDTTYPAEIWLDDDGLLRRFKFTMSYNVPGTGSAETTIEEELYDFGVDADISPPPADRVLDGTKFLPRS